jgi:hypothetical protein
LEAAVFARYAVLGWLLWSSRRAEQLMIEPNAFALASEP